MNYSYDRRSSADRDWNHAYNNFSRDLIELIKNPGRDLKIETKKRRGYLPPEKEIISFRVDAYNFDDEIDENIIERSEIAAQREALEYEKKIKALLKRMRIDYPNFKVDPIYCKFQEKGWFTVTLGFPP